MRWGSDIDGREWGRERVQLSLIRRINEAEKK